MRGCAPFPLIQLNSKLRTNTLHINPCLVSKQKKKPQKKRENVESDFEISDLSDGDVSDLCDDNDFDDVEFSFTPAETAEENEECLICGEKGKPRELWYRCIFCASWNHAACTDADKPDDYVCDNCRS